MANKRSEKSENKKQWKIALIVVLIIVLFLSWIGLTQSGYIPNFLDIDYLCPGKRNGEFNRMEFDKPVIYLYPEKEQEVLVKLNFQGEIIADYPKYDESIQGWNIIAHPDGKIIDLSDLQEYNYLFWEGTPLQSIKWDFSTGFVVKGQDTRDFLKNKLQKIGLNNKEINDFIVYWYPKMQNNKYNLIHFAEDQYTKIAQLKIFPEPNSILRVFMVYKPLENFIEIKEQEIKPFKRQGFTVVEWGGTEFVQ